MDRAEPVFLRRAADPGEVFLTASASGILGLRNDCLVIGETSIVWPSSARVYRDDQGRISILNTISGKSVRVGERLTMGGGEVPRLEPGRLQDGAANLARCPGPYFLADNEFRPG